MLKRFEGQFGAQLVRKTYTFIILSRYGMSEEELLLITGKHPLSRGKRQPPLLDDAP